MSEWDCETHGCRIVKGYCRYCEVSADGTRSKPAPTPVEPKSQVESPTYKRIPSSPVCAKRGLWPYPCAGRIELQRDGSMKGAFLCEEHAFQSAQQAQVESASVGAISDHEKGQKEEFYKFQQHLEKTQEEISKWPSWMREAGRASMGLDQREPKEVESGGLPERIWIAAYTASEYAGVLSRGLYFRSIHDSEDDARRMQRDPQAIGFTVTEYTKADQLKASLLREQNLKELLGEAANAIARHWDITDQAAKDVALKARAAAVTGD